MWQQRERQGAVRVVDLTTGKALRVQFDFESFINAPPRISVGQPVLCHLGGTGIGEDAGDLVAESLEFVASVGPDVRERSRDELTEEKLLHAEVERARAAGLEFGRD